MQAIETSFSVMQLVSNATCVFQVDKQIKICVFEN